jgi:hypothetical protein
MTDQQDIAYEPTSGREQPEGGPTQDALDRCTTVFRHWLHLPDPGPLLVVLGAVAANLGPGDPVWLLLVGPPGCGKTEILSPISALPDAHSVSTLTEAALLSGTPQKDVGPTARGGLLREVGERGIIVAKDFGSVISMPRDPRAATLAALREIYDGTWTRRLGTDGGRELSWSGKVGLIAAVTQAIDSYQAVMGSMGERFVLYRMPPTDPDEQARKALSHLGQEALMRRSLSEAVAMLLATSDPVRLTAVPDETTRERLVWVASLAARCRSAVERDGYTREVINVPEPEAPARLAFVLLRLLNGLRSIGVGEHEAWRIVSKAALDSMTAIRRQVMEALIVRPKVSLADVAALVGYPLTTTRRALEDLTYIHILDREAAAGARPDNWAVSDWARARWPSFPEVSGEAGQAEGGDGVRPSYLSLRIDDDNSGTLG